MPSQILRTLVTSAIFLFLQMGLVSADDCADNADQATMNACAAQSFEKSDKELNGLYKQIETRLADEADAKRLLVAAQRAWIAFRDAECKFSSSAVAQGSAYPMVAAQCRDKLTKDRIGDFKTYLSCEEGDLSCPVPASD